MRISFVTRLISILFIERSDIYISHVYTITTTMDLETKVAALEIENLELKEAQLALEEELATTKAHLKKYTAPASSRDHYTKNKTAILEKKKNNPTSSEMRKIYNRRSYLKRKEKEKEKKD